MKQEKLVTEQIKNKVEQVEFVDGTSSPLMVNTEDKIRNKVEQVQFVDGTSSPLAPITTDEGPKS